MKFGKCRPRLLQMHTRRRGTPSGWKPGIASEAARARRAMDSSDGSASVTPAARRRWRRRLMGAVLTGVGVMGVLAQRVLNNLLCTTAWIIERKPWSFGFVAATMRLISARSAKL